QPVVSHQPDYTLLGTSPITAMQGQTTGAAPTKPLDANRLTLMSARPAPCDGGSVQQRDEVIHLARIGCCERVDDGGEGSSRRAPRGLFMYPPRVLARRRYLPAPSA